jgi:hypothetical protein
VYSLSLVDCGGKFVRQRWRRRKSREREKTQEGVFGRDGTGSPLRSSNKSDAVEKSDLYMADLSWAGG